MFQEGVYLIRMPVLRSRYRESMSETKLRGKRRKKKVLKSRKREKLEIEKKIKER